MWTRRSAAAALLAPALSLFVSPSAAQESSSFVMERACVGSAGEALVSTSYRNHVVVNPTHPFGTASSCAGGIRTDVGFCLRPGEVPSALTLQARPNPNAPDAVDLLWNGAAAIYQLYRDFDPVAVVAPGNLLAETGQCQVTDGGSGKDIVFYNVIEKP